VRVAFVYRNLNRSGSLERDSVFLLEGLATRGIELHCYCDPETSVDVDGVVRRDVSPLTRSRSRLGFPLLRASFAARATRALRAERSRYDLVHVLGVSAWEHDVVHVPAVMAAEQACWPQKAGHSYRAARAKLAPLLRPEVGAVRAIERLQFRPGHYLRATVVTAEVRDDLVRVHGVPPERVDVVPPAIDVGRFARAKDGSLRGDLAIEPDRNVILFIGHAFERKGLADAVTALAQSGTGAHLVVVGGRRRPGGVPSRGGGAWRGRPRALCPARWTAPRTTTGRRPPCPADAQRPLGDPRDRGDGSGVPVVTTEAAGSASVARDAGAGVVVPPRSPERLARAIGELLGDPARRREMGERGRAEAGRFDIASVVDATLAVYEHALAEKRA